MRTTRFLTLLLLLALLLSGCDSTIIQQFRATPTLGFTRQPTWTRIPSLTASIAPTRTPRPTRTITPTPTITPTHWPTRTPEVMEVEPEVIASEQAAPILGVTYRQVKNTFEPLGFVFPESMPLSTTLVHTATLPAMPMALEILGSPDFPVEASLQFKLTMDEPERTKQAAVIMVRLLNLILPAWDEASAWLFESIQEGLTSSDDFYDRSTERDGLSVVLEMDRADGNVLLTVRSNPPSE
jgi:hypothetical protein